MKDGIALVVLAVVLVGAAALLASGLIMLAWNGSVAEIFGWPQLNYGQAFWLTVLIGGVTGSLRTR